MKDEKKKYPKKKKKQSAAIKALNRFMPYILSVLAAVVLFAMSGLAGGFGDGLRNGLYGVFSNFATYFLPIFMIYHAIMWNYDIKRKICLRRVICSLITLMSFSTMQYLVQVGKHPAINIYSMVTFFVHGKASIGGGIVGGIFGKLLLGVGNILGVVIISFVLLFMVLQMFNITPVYMVRSMLKNKKSQPKPMAVRQAQPVRRERPVRQRPVYVPVDEDDEEEAFLENTKVVSVDDIDSSSEYEELNIRKINAETEHIPSQLQPYGDTDENEAVEELSVSSTRYSSHDDDDDETLFVPASSVGSASNDEAEDGYYEDTAVFDDVDEPDAGDDSDFTDDYDSSDDIEREIKSEISYISDDLLNKATQKPEKCFTVAEQPGEDKAEKKERRVRVKDNKPKINYALPPLYFLKSQPDNSNSDDVRAELQENAKIIVDTLNDFKAPTRIVDVTRGPTITRYELQPEKGVRVSKIESLVNDIALNLAAKGIRIECPIPGKNAIGIEVPNRTISFVYLRDLIEDPRFDRAKSKLTCALGKSIAGENIYVDIEGTPHLLVAGATGMGKSVCINSLLVSLLYKAKPDDVRLILIDPKRVELSNYNGIPHLLVPVVCEPKKSLGALQWAVTEMEQRFMDIEEAGVRNIKEFNEKVENGYDAEKMARIVIVIDELADLKMAVPDIEGHITRLTQKARAAGIHIIIGTQRPSVDVLTGLIKNNIPSRIAFRVPSQVDSRTILDEVGAEKLVAKGDMLVKIVGALNPVRVQGAYVSVDEIQDVIDYWKDSGPANYDEEVMQQIDNNAAKLAKNDRDMGDDEEGGGDDLDPVFYEALEVAAKAGKISSSFLQRKFSLGFGRAARIIDQMEMMGYVGEANGTKPRDVLISKEDYHEIMMRRNDE